MSSAASNENTERIGVLLFNLGGPERLDQVRPFLYNLFSDPDIIRLPWRGLQSPLAWLIARQRYKLSRGYYKKIGGGSPLRKITEDQASALQAALAAEGIDAGVYVGMRYWDPFIDDALADIRKDRVTRLVVLPLYPQYSVSTTGPPGLDSKQLSRRRPLYRRAGGYHPRGAVDLSRSSAWRHSHLVQRP